MTTLNLTLKKQWFDMIQSGEKSEEYREINTYWAARLLDFGEEMEWAAFYEMVMDMRNPFNRHCGPGSLMHYFNISFKKFKKVRFRNGYAKNAPEFTVDMDYITIDTGRPEWGAEPGKFYFVLRLDNNKVARERFWAKLETVVGGVGK